MRKIHSAGPHDPRTLGFVSCADAARLLGLRRSTIYWRIHNGTLPALQITSLSGRKGQYWITQFAIYCAAQAGKQGSWPMRKAQA